ncbi:MAG: nucleotide exchange factor GrpE [Oscillospiraceae bacterium]|nr:nucleotide exchange factor GrpE [Oscillospiraceae bacterium]
MNEEKDKKETAPETEAQPVPEEPQESPEEEKTDKKADKKDEKKEKKFGRKKEDERVAALEAEKDALEKDKAALNDKYLRICAEYDNFRRRSQKEKDNLYGEIKANTVQQFLPVYDNLTRALKQGTEDEAYRKGVEMIMTQFENTLEKLGVKKIESLGQTFDPKLHNAVMHVDDEEQGENTIVEVFQEGFTVNDRVIRFAMVKVAN